jgi:hypothetical protein
MGKRKQQYLDGLVEKQGEPAFTLGKDGQYRNSLGHLVDKNGIILYDPDCSYCKDHRMVNSNKHPKPEESKEEPKQESVKEEELTDGNNPE